MAVLAKAVLISRNVHCFLYNAAVKNTAMKIVRRDIGQPMDRNVTDLDADLETGLLLFCTQHRKYGTVFDQS